MPKLLRQHGKKRTVIDCVAPAVIVIVPLRSMAEKQVKNNEFDLFITLAVVTEAQEIMKFHFIVYCEVSVRWQWISVISRKRLMLFLLHSTFLLLIVTAGVIFTKL